MAKRLKKAKVYGIRPHVFHIWADDLIEGVEMQHRRLLAYSVPMNTRYLREEELTPILDVTNRRARIDFDLYFVLMRRLLRTAEEAAAEGYGSQALRRAIKDFKTAMRGLLEARDAGEHADEWLPMGQTRSWGLALGDGDDGLFTHGQDEFLLKNTSAAARDLYHAIKERVPSGAPADIVPPLRPGEAARAIREGTWHPGRSGLVGRPAPIVVGGRACDSKRRSDSAAFSLAQSGGEDVQQRKGLRAGSQREDERRLGS